MTTTHPAPRPLTVPEQRALEALARAPQTVSTLRGLTAHRVLGELTGRQLAAYQPGVGGRWVITDRGRAYLRTLGVTE